jgi:Ca2+-binding EF-hand superfamily protein
MNPRLRQQRSTFLLFMGAIYVSLMAALPLVTAQLSMARYAMSEPNGGQPTFEQLDRNRDGYVDRKEAVALPGLDAVFDAADRRADGKLDKVEYAKALAMMDERK